MIFSKELLSKRLLTRRRPGSFGGQTSHFGAGFALNEKGQPVLASVDLDRIGAEAFRLNLVDGTSETKALAYPEAVGHSDAAAKWFAKGFDYTPATEACVKHTLPGEDDAQELYGALVRQSCDVVALTPDKKYWLLSRGRGFERLSLMAMKSENLELVGEFKVSHFVKYMLGSESDDPTVFLMRAGPNVQSYRYQAVGSQKP